MSNLPLGFKPAPLNSTFMAISLAGFLFSAVYLWSISTRWAFAFGTVFVIMFIAAFISMAYAPIGKVK